MSALFFHTSGFGLFLLPFGLPPLLVRLARLAMLAALAFSVFAFGFLSLCPHVGQNSSPVKSIFSIAVCFFSFRCYIECWKVSPFLKGGGFLFSASHGLSVVEADSHCLALFFCRGLGQTSFRIDRRHIHQSTLLTSFILHHLLSGCFDFQRTVDLSPVNKHNILYVC